MIGESSIKAKPELWPLGVGHLCSTPQRPLTWEGQMKAIGIRIIFLILLGMFAAGCQSNELVKPPVPHSISGGPDLVRLDAKSINQSNSPWQFNYFPGIAKVLGGNVEGALVGFLWSDEKGEKTYSALYLIDPAKGIAEKVLEPADGGQIFNASLDDRWVVWAERTQKSWRLVSYDRLNKSTQTLDQGEYFPEAGRDYPSATVEGGIVVYNTSQKNAGKVISQLVLINLETAKRQVLAKAEGSDTYFGPPRLNQGYVTWHQGWWDRDLNGVVYGLDLAHDKVERIPWDQPAITPSIWGRYIVFVTYDRSSPETKNVVLYDLVTKRGKYLTNAKPEHRMEFWWPTVSHGIVTWRSNRADSPISVHMARREETRDLGVVGQEQTVYGSWMVWRNPQQGPGILLMGFERLFVDIDLTGRNADQWLTQMPFSLRGDLTPQDLVRLTPPEAAIIYHEALRTKRWDIAAMLLSDGPIPKEEWLAGIGEAAGREPPVAVSRDYMIQGDVAFVGVRESISERVKGQQSHTVEQQRAWHLHRENGIWKVDQLAAQ